MASEIAIINRELKRRQKEAQAIDDELTLREIDYTNKNPQELRGAISKLPKHLQQKARARWADEYVKRDRSKGTLAHSPLGTINDMVRHAARGTIAGPYLDEWSAWVNSGFDSDSPEYGETLAYQRAVDRATDKDYGLAGIIPKIAGGVTEALAVPAMLPFRAGAYTSNVVKGGAIGAGHAANAGFGQGEGGVENRLQSAQNAAPYGLAFGAGVPAVTGAVAPALGRAYEAIRPAVTPITRGPARAADLSIAKRVEDVGGGDLRAGVNHLVDDIRQGQHASHYGTNSVARLPEALADRSNGLQRLAGTIYRQGGRPAEVVASRLERRQRGPQNLYDRGAQQQPAGTGQTGQSADITDAFERALRVRIQDTPHQTMQRLRQEAQDEGRALYRQAYESQEPFDISDVLVEALNRYQTYGSTSLARQLRRAVGYFAPQPQRTMFRGAPPNAGDTRRAVQTLEQFDNAKKALDDDIEKAMRKGARNLARELTELKNSLMSRVDEANPNYATARTAWGGRREQQEALDAGRNAFREDSEVTVDMYRQFGQPLQQLFRVGLLDAMRKMNRTAHTGTDRSRMFQQDRVVELLREVIPNERLARHVYGNRSGRFGEFVNRQGRMVQTRNTVMGGSPTARNQQDDAGEAIRTLSQAWDQFRQNPNFTRMVMDGVGVLGNRYLGFREDVAIQIVRRLMQMNPEAQVRYLQSLERRVGPDPLNAFMREVSRLTEHASREIGRGIGRNVAIEDE